MQEQNSYNLASKHRLALVEGLVSLIQLVKATFKCTDMSNYNDQLI